MDWLKNRITCVLTVLGCDASMVLIGLARDGSFLAIRRDIRMCRIEIEKVVANGLLEEGANWDLSLR